MSHLISKKIDGKNKLFNKKTKEVEGDLPKDDDKAKKEAVEKDEVADKGSLLIIKVMLDRGAKE